MEPGPLRDCGHGIFRVGLHVGDMNRLAFEQNSTRDRPSARFDRMILHILAVLAWHAASGDMKKAQGLRSPNRYHIRVAQARDRFYKRIEHRL